MMYFDFTSLKDIATSFYINTLHLSKLFFKIGILVGLRCGFHHGSELTHLDRKNTF